MVAEQEARACAGASLPVGEPVTLVIEDERFFGWVASASPAYSLACVAIEFVDRNFKRYFATTAARRCVSRVSSLSPN